MADTPDTVEITGETDNVEMVGKPVHDAENHVEVGKTVHDAENHVEVGKTVHDAEMKPEVAVTAALQAVEAEVHAIGSGSESSSSRSSSRSRSRERKNKTGGAAAATALITAHIAIDVDETEKIVTRELTFPTSFAARFSHEGGTVAIMVETGTEIQVQPRHLYPDDSVVLISGKAVDIERAVAQVQSAYEQHKQETAAADTSNTGTRLGQFEIPAAHLHAVVGANESAISEIRGKCGGIMIAMMPAEKPGDPLTAYIGPGPTKDVDLAEKILRGRLAAAESGKGGNESAQKAAAPLAAEKAVANGGSLMVRGPPPPAAPPSDGDDDLTLL